MFHLKKRQLPARYVTFLLPRGSCCAGDFFEEPVTKGPHFGPLGRLRRVCHIVGEIGGQTYREWLDQPPGPKVIGDERAAAKDNPFTLNCRLHRMIRGFEPGTAVRVDALDPGSLEPRGPIDFEGIVDQRVVLQVRGTFEGMRRLSEASGCTPEKLLRASAARP